jgi:hypothetical protein
MVSQNQATIIVAIFTFIGGLAGFFAKYYLDRKQAFSSANAQIKRDAYTEFLDKLLKTTSKFKDKLTLPEVEAIKREFGQYNKEFYGTSVLFASPKVVKKYADFVRNENTIQSGLYQYELMLKASRFYKAMRKDIGLSNRGLGWDGELLLRANINDYDSTIRSYTKWFNRVKRWLASH